MSKAETIDGIDSDGSGIDKAPVVWILKRENFSSEEWAFVLFDAAQQQAEFGRKCVEIGTCPGDRGGCGKPSLACVNSEPLQPDVGRLSMACAACGYRFRMDVDFGPDRAAGLM